MAFGLKELANSIVFENRSRVTSLTFGSTPPGLKSMKGTVDRYFKPISM